MHENLRTEKKHAMEVILVGWFGICQIINQKCGQQTFRRRFVSGSLFVSLCPPECYFQSEMTIEPDLRLDLDMQVFSASGIWPNYGVGFGKTQNILTAVTWFDCYLVSWIHPNLGIGCGIFCLSVRIWEVVCCSGNMGVNQLLSKQTVE